MAIDFEAEGLLEGTSGEQRAARLKLLEFLVADGTGLEELKAAVAEDRLALLPAERVLAREADTYTAEEVAEKVGAGVDQLMRLREALGLPRADDGARAFGERDVEVARHARTLLEAGLPEEGMLDVARLIGMSMAQLAAATRDLAGAALLRPGDTESDVGLRYAAAIEHLTPLVTPLLEYALTVHQRELLRQAAISQADLTSGEIGGAADVAVSFCDMVGFTTLGERLEPDELGPLVARLGELAGQVAKGPVRLIKLIGDAAMLVSPEPEALVGATLELLESSGEEGKDFPELRAGLAFGPALPRGGDWYGRPVNLASRITGVARPGTALASKDLRAEVKEQFDWSRIRPRRLKNIEGEQQLYRVKRLNGETNGDGG